MITVRSYLVLVLLFSAAWQAGASVPLGGNRKGVGGTYDMYGCMQSNDYFVVNFAAYQIDPNKAQDDKSMPVAECIDFPTTGRTQITLDLLDRDVRKKQVALKILQEDGQVLVELPMTVAKQGVISTSLDFKAAGKYQAILYVNDTDMNTPPEVSALHIPLTVALAVDQPANQGGLLVLVLIIAAFVAAAAFYVPRLLKPSPAESPN